LLTPHKVYEKSAKMKTSEAAFRQSFHGRASVICLRFKIAALFLKGSENVENFIKSKLYLRLSTTSAAQHFLTIKAYTESNNLI
jgi:hypothetical protein